ncbi:AMP-binding protein [Sulfitobacter donghicola]|uniref:AMP-dependent synthetase n=1 Tax=Sulfitobacter donghicola DSW-25 = KCTC 12864 = JCM 14565 TaxID=1300350 RepID=A0A073IGD9_9RHOB|nr:AMP-binding protein [Sulfitobacter donghicola]KEJ89408.1 AMP-dependent synthetase [Sulfitobacter donghicola DSW-25 = KCTC 12864 = JCM 14565]KIN69225.1 Acetyl-coenzyme A synthetase [Sulfitobacter donghicola DSW-25 = KCTC 12864 = JCM 14565]
MQPMLPGLDGEGRWSIPARLNMARQCLAQPDEALAVIDLTGTGRRDVTFGALGEMVDGLARALSLKVQAGDRVGVLLSQSPWCVAAHLAIWKIGAISVPLFKLFRHDALEARLTDSGTGLVLTDEEGAELLGDLAEAWMADQVGVAGEPVAFADTAADDPAVLIYTSGTTGSAKGALHGHRVLTGHLPGVATSHDFLGQEDDCLWTPADWAWIGGLFDVAMPALALGVPVVAARMAKFDVETCRSIIQQGNVRNVFFPPTALRMLKAADAQISGLRSVASGGEPLGAQMLAWGRKAFGVEINEFYGQTECNMVASSCGAAFEARAGCIGKAVQGFELAVLDNGLPTTGEGEVAVKRGAASMMIEYWQRPVETAQKFEGDWMLTGDRGIWEGDYLRFVGREDDVITSSGYRIGPAEIEDCLLTHPAVSTVGVVGKPDALRTEIVKAYVVLKQGQEATEQVLKDWVKERLAGYSYPREVTFLDALPMTVTGKVIRRELKARAVSEGAR